MWYDSYCMNHTVHAVQTLSTAQYNIILLIKYVSYFDTVVCSAGTGLSIPNLMVRNHHNNMEIQVCEIDAL